MIASRVGSQGVRAKRISGFADEVAIGAIRVAQMRMKWIISAGS